MKGTGCVSSTAKLVNCSERAVARWWKRYNDTGAVDSVSYNSGRKRSVTPQAARLALDMLVNPEYRGADHVASILQQEGIISSKVHKSTLIRQVYRAAKLDGVKLRVRRGKPAKGLTQATKTKRLNFANANKSRQWSCVLFTDRKKFHFSYPGSKVKCVQWVRDDADGSSEEVYMPNHPQCVNVYAGIAINGVTDVHVVTGTSKHSSPFKTQQGKAAKNITAEEYKTVMHLTLLKGGTDLATARGEGTWVLQQDNDPSHKCATSEVQKWNEQHHSSVQLLPDWPPNSPDLNIIEHVWAYTQARVNARGCKTFDAFKDAVISELKAVPQAYIASLYKSIPKRIASVIEKEGGKTKY